MLDLSFNWIKFELCNRIVGIYFKDKQCAWDGFFASALPSAGWWCPSCSSPSTGPSCSCISSKSSCKNTSCEEHRQQLLYKLPALCQDDQVGGIFSIFLWAEELTFQFFVEVWKVLCWMTIVPDESYEPAVTVKFEKKAYNLWLCFHIS